MVFQIWQMKTVLETGWWWGGGIGWVVDIHEALRSCLCFRSTDSSFGPTR